MTGTRRVVASRVMIRNATVGDGECGRVLYPDAAVRFLNRAGASWGIGLRETLCVLYNAVMPPHSQPGAGGWRKPGTVRHVQP